MSKCYCAIKSSLLFKLKYAIEYYFTTEGTDDHCIAEEEARKLIEEINALYEKSEPA